MLEKSKIERSDSFTLEGKSFIIKLESENAIYSSDSAWEAGLILSIELRKKS